MNFKMDSDRLLGFLSGEFMVMITFINVEDLMKTILLGLVGGIVGVFAKDLYHWIKSLLKSIF